MRCIREVTGIARKREPDTLRVISNFKQRLKGISPFSSEDDEDAA
jgi:hypothetical protein